MKKMKNPAVFAAIASVLSVASIEAHAALPTGINDFFTEITTDVTTVGNFAAGVVVLWLGFAVGIKLAKRGANKV